MCDALALVPFYRKVQKKLPVGYNKTSLHLIQYMISIETDLYEKLLDYYLVSTVMIHFTPQVSNLIFCGS